MRDGSGGFRRAAAGKDSQPPEHLLLCRIEQIITPGNRGAQGALARGHIARPADQQIEGRPARRAGQASQQ